MLSTRPLSIQFGGLSRTDGSAKFGFGNTLVLASLSGPIEVRPALELPSRAALEVLVRPLSGVPGTAEKTLGKRLCEVLNQMLLLNHHPRTLIQVVLQSLTCLPLITGTSNHLYIDASTTAAMINAASLAILHASSIPIQATLCAVAIAKHRESGRFVIDPDPQANDCERTICFGFLFSQDRIGNLVWTDWQGACEQIEYQKALDTARVGALVVLDFIRSEITRSLGDSQ